jgi:hypothetical protein
VQYFRAAAYDGNSIATVTDRGHGDVVGPPYSSVVAPEQLSHVHRQFTRKVSGEATTTDYDLILLDSEGRRVPARVHSVSLASDDHDAAVFGLAIPTSVKPTNLLRTKPMLGQGCSLRSASRRH